MNDATDFQRWAETTFDQAELGDVRRTRRLVRLAAGLAAADGASTARAHADDEAAHEGAYRFLRNRRVAPAQIAEAGFRASAERARGLDDLLAIEDSSTLGYTHGAAKALGDLGGPEGTRTRGFHVHSVLLVARDSGATLGLVEQRYWVRDDGDRGKKHRRCQRPYEDKESFKWQASAEALRSRFGAAWMRRVISVCDREADIYEYLTDKIAHGERFVVRASWNRALAAGAGYLRDSLDAARVIGHATVDVPQRAGRVAREATLTLRRRRVTLRRPVHRTIDGPVSLTVAVVLAREEHAPPGVEPLEWLLLTSEPIARRQDVLTVLRTYRRRWRIEEFHRVWKSGVGVERCRMQHPSNIQRLAIILAFVATRVLQLREAFDTNPHGPCTVVLRRTEWKILWTAVEKTRPPESPPTVTWAYRAIGRLGGWYDSKRTGRVGPKALTEGWDRLDERIAGFRAARLLTGEAL